MAWEDVVPAVLVGAAAGIFSPKVWNWYEQRKVEALTDEQAGRLVDMLKATNPEAAAKLAAEHGLSLVATPSAGKH